MGGLEEASTFPMKFILGLVLLIFVFVIMFGYASSLQSAIQHLSNKIVDFFNSLIPG